MGAAERAGQSTIQPHALLVCSSMHSRRVRACTPGVTGVMHSRRVREPAKAPPSHIDSHIRTASRTIGQAMTDGAALRRRRVVKSSHIQWRETRSWPSFDGRRSSARNAATCMRICAYVYVCACAKHTHTLSLSLRTLSPRPETARAPHPLCLTSLCSLSACRRFPSPGFLAPLSRMNDISPCHGPLLPALVSPPPPSAPL